MWSQEQNKDAHPVPGTREGFSRTSSACIIRFRYRDHYL